MILNKILKLAVLTTGRQDWSVLSPLCRAFQADDFFSIMIMAGGMACSSDFGRVVDTIRSSGFIIDEEFPWQMKVTAAEQAAECLKMVAETLTRRKPDAILLVGDRYETLAAALAATLTKTPIIHLYGGEETEGAFDNSMRHAITKLSHLHFVSHQEYARRICLMGEDPQAVHVVGYINVDNMLNLKTPSRKDLEDDLQIQLTSPVGLATLHPTTLNESEQVDRNELEAVLGVIKEFPATWVITLPNADPGNDLIRAAFLQAASTQKNIVAVSALGEAKYFGLMKNADFMLGNSSSGLIEAPYMKIPTINIGDRQKGRIRCSSVIDVVGNKEQIIKKIQHALSSEFRLEVQTMEFPFGRGDTAQKIVDILRNWVPPSPPRKVFLTTVI